MKRVMASLALVAAVAAASVGLVACAATAEADGDGGAVQPGNDVVKSDSRGYIHTHYTFWQELPDGTRVLCVWAEGSRSGGLSCNWNDVQS